jgi:hypothetical protein
MKEKKKKLPDRVMIPDQGLKYYGKTGAGRIKRR